MAEEVKCPICGSETVERKAQKGPNVGRTFSVCNRYPECKGKVEISEEEDVDGFLVGQEENKLVSKEEAKDTVAEEESSKSRTIALLLCFFLGSLGAHRFYLVKNPTAITMLVLWVIGIATVWILIGIPFLIAVGIWSLIDLILILVGAMKDGEGRLVTKWEA
jgi:TM2 domain-containing membrane protein YozV